MSFEDILGDIDKSFSEKKQQEVYMTYVMIVAAFLAVSYLLFWDSAEQGYNRTVAATKIVEKKLRDDQNYLKYNTPAKIAQLKAQTVGYKSRFIALKDQSEYIKYKIEQISSLYYDEQAWGQFIDSIAENAKKYGVKLHFLSNSFSNDKGTFGHILDIQIKSTGSFHRTMRFINSLEKSFLVVDIHSLDLKSGQKIDSDLKISVWGITY